MRTPLLPNVLRYVDQVARSGSIQRAAVELNIAASAVDRQILLLEQDLGVKLFERHSRGMQLTPTGEVVVALARDWAGDVRRLSNELRHLRGLEQGHVRFAAMDSHVNGYLPAVIEALARDHPRISLEVEIATTEEALTALFEGSIDLAVAFNVPPRRDLHVLWQESLPFGYVVAPSHPLATRPPARMQQVVDHRLVLQGRGLAIRRYLDAQFHWLFADHPPATVTNSLQLLKQLVLTGGYVAFTSELDAAAEIAAGLLRFKPVRDSGLDPQTIAIAIDGRRPLPRVVKVVADAITAEIVRSLTAAREVPTRHLR